MPSTTTATTTTTVQAQGNTPIESTGRYMWTNGHNNYKQPTDPHQPQTLGPSDQTCQILAAASRTHVDRGFCIVPTLGPWHPPGIWLVLVLDPGHAKHRELGNEQLTDLFPLETQTPPPAAAVGYSSNLPRYPRGPELPSLAGRSPKCRLQVQRPVQRCQSSKKVLNHACM